MSSERSRDPVSTPKNPGPRYSRKDVRAYQIDPSILVFGPEHPGLAEGAPAIGGEPVSGPAWLFPLSSRAAITELYSRLFPPEDEVREPGPEAGPKVRVHLHDAHSGDAPSTQLLPAAEAIALLADASASLESPDDHQGLLSWARERFCSLAEELETYTRALRCLEIPPRSETRSVPDDAGGSAMHSFPRKVPDDAYLED
jgi:hypothetical protein